MIHRSSLKEEPVKEFRDVAVATIAMTSSADKTQNIATAMSYVRQAAAEGAQWVLLPEMFSYMGPYDALYEVAEDADGPLVVQLASLARELAITLFAGTLPERPSAQDKAALGPATVVNALGQRKVYNTLYGFAPSGAMIVKYRKTHLFHLRAEDGGSNLYCETDGFLAGDSLETFNHQGWRIGCSICYDLRFPELYAAMARTTPLDLILAPSAFTYGTGKPHWRLLVSARAVEQQSYMMAANQTGEHSPGKQTWGHGLIVSPWGEVLGDNGNKPGIAHATIRKEVLAATRQRLPALGNRRPELYRV